MLAQTRPSCLIFLRWVLNRLRLHHEAKRLRRDDVDSFVVDDQHDPGEIPEDRDQRVRAHTAGRGLLLQLVEADDLVEDLGVLVSVGLLLRQRFECNVDCDVEVTRFGGDAEVLHCTAFR